MTRSYQVAEQVCASLAYEGDLRDARVLRPILDALRQYQSEGYPERVRVMQGTSFMDAQWGPLEPFRLSELSALLQSRSDPWERMIEFRWKTTPDLVLLLTLRNQLPYDLAILCRNRYMITSIAEQRDFVAVACNIFQIGTGIHGILGTSATKRWRRDEMGLRVTGSHTPLGGLPPPEWGMLLGRTYVSRIGPQRVRDSPCDAVRELPDGSFLLLLTEDLSEIERTPQVFEARRDVLITHLGQGFFTGTKASGRASNSRVRERRHDSPHSNR